jgi:MinD superfamily P-loop ATPase
MGTQVQLVDCDVEEPNCHLLIGCRLLNQETAAIRVPEVDESICDGCGECSRFCRYHAIVSFGSSPLFFSGLCHGCGGCQKVCTRGAITEKDQRIGVVETFESGDITLIHGRLDVGVAMAPPLVRSVKSHVKEEPWAILDAPPGTSCPVISTLRGSDFVILVTEPTPFGLHDLKLAVEMVEELGSSFGVVINRVGIGDERVYSYCAGKGIPVLLEIPDDRRIAEVCSRGELVVDAVPEYGFLFSTLLWNIRELKKKGKGIELGSA